MTKKHYIREIADRTCLPPRYRKKIISDLTEEFDQLLSSGLSEAEVIQRMGNSDDIAEGIYENYAEIEELSRPFLEYKSKTELFGMPLVHIVKAKRYNRINRYNNKFNMLPTARGVIAIGQKARGIVAIGNLCCGVVAIGNLCAGIFTFANIGAGLFSLGNLCIGLLLAMSNGAVGLFGFGNAVLSFNGFGNAVLARYAVGNAVLGKYVLRLNEQVNLSEQISGFISDLPKITQKFFGMCANLTDHFYILIAVIIITVILIIVSGILISNKMENELQ